MMKLDAERTGHCEFVTLFHSLVRLLLYIAIHVSIQLDGKLVCNFACPHPMFHINCRPGTGHNSGAVVLSLVYVVR